MTAMACSFPMFQTYLARWSLLPDGCPIISPTAHLLPVIGGGQPGILKLPLDEDEHLGGVLMEW